MLFCVSILAGSANSVIHSQKLYIATVGIDFGTTYTAVVQIIFAVARYVLRILK